MSVLTSISPKASCCIGGHLVVPPWVTDLLQGSRNRTEVPAVGTTVQVCALDEFSLVSVCAADTRDLSADAFERKTAEIYRIIERELKSGPARHPVRVWNHLPDIHSPSGEPGLDRYMAFNAGRFRAYSDWLGGAGAFDQTVPSASAVGHDGRELVVHALGCRTPGIAVANPRQIAPHRYSKRFGPLPPCFARATMLAGENNSAGRILVGGTASIRGEDSIFLHDIGSQTAETFLNLAHLVRNAAEGNSSPAGDLSPADARRWLCRFSNLRAYYLHESDRAFIEARVDEEFDGGCSVEYVRANLCRAELLVEIEGLAQG